MKAQKIYKTYYRQKHKEQICILKFRKIRIKIVQKSNLKKSKKIHCLKFMNKLIFI